MDLNLYNDLDSVYLLQNINAGLRILLYFPLTLLAVYFFILTIFSLLKANLSTKIKRGFLAIAVLLLVLGFAGYLILLFMKNQQLLKISTNIWRLFILLSSLFVLFYGISRVKSRPTRGEKQALFVFFIIYIAIYTFHGIDTYIIRNNELTVYYCTPIRWLIINLIPLCGLRCFMKFYHCKDLELLKISETLDSFSNKYNLSERETEIVSMIILGKSNKEIADDLFISIQTVKNHLHNIYKKSGTGNRLAIMKIALDMKK